MSDTRETVTLYGVTFADIGPGDWVRCCTCGEVVDVGGELREHAARHVGDRLER